MYFFFFFFLLHFNKKIEIVQHIKKNYSEISEDLFYCVVYESYTMPESDDEQMN
jgi:hypothetical protein